MDNLSLGSHHSFYMPAKLEEYLDDCPSQCLAFSNQGTFLALGSLKGVVLIFDFETRVMSNKLKYNGHSRTVISLEWSRDGKEIISIGKDRALIIWNIVTGKPRFKAYFDKDIASVAMDPVRCRYLVVCLKHVSPAIAKINNTIRQSLDSKNNMSKIKYIKKINMGKFKTKKNCLDFCACWDPKGDFFITGSNDGMIRIFNLLLENHQIVSKLLFYQPVLSYVFSNGNSLLSLNIERKGNNVIVSSANGTIEVIRYINVGLFGFYGIILNAKLSVNFFENILTQNCLSPNTKWIATGLQSRVKHRIIVWVYEGGKLNRILLTESVRDGLVNLCWHPRSNYLAALTTPKLNSKKSGRIYIFAPLFRESWSNYDPAFCVLSSNKENKDNECEFHPLEGVGFEDEVETKEVSNRSDIEIEDDESIQLFDRTDPFFWSSEEEDLRIYYSI
jgi:COMPASS component SWD1